MNDEVLTIRQVAEYLRVTEKTVYGLALVNNSTADEGTSWRRRFWESAQNHRACIGRL